MRIARFENNGLIGTGIVKGDALIDLLKVGSAFSDLPAIIDHGDEALAELRQISEEADPHLKLSDIRLLAPLHPKKYLAIGMNYMKHVEEAKRKGIAEPKYQYWFNKQTTCISGPFDDIDPGVTEMLDYEAELGVVIGKRAKGVKRTDALSYVFGYLVANDVSARDWQVHTPTFTMGKSFDTHGPIGPWIVTADEVPDPQALDFRCLVNGEVRQQSNTVHMIYSVAEQIEYLSTAFTLEPGDLIATGTPEGVGAAMEPPVYLQPGDVVRCEIDGIGAIENKVVAP